MKGSTILDITTTRSALLSALTAAARIANGKVMPCLGSMFIECGEDGKARWWANDFDIWRGGVLEVESVAQPGAALLSVQQATPLVKSCAAVPVSLRFEPTRVHVTAGGLSAKMPSFDVKDYPARPVVPAEGIALPTALFYKMIQQVEPLVTIAGSQPYMRGAQFTLDASGLLLVAIAPHQVAKTSVAFPTTPEKFTSEDATAILPKQTLVEVASMLKNAETVIYRNFERKHAFTIDNQTLVSRVMDAKFPAWQNIVPKGITTRVVVEREAFSELVSRVATACDVEARRVSLSFEGGKVTVSAQSIATGEAIEQMHTDQQGPDLEVFMKDTYLQEFLASAGTPRVSFEFADAKQPFLFCPVESPDLDFTYVVAGMSATGS